MFFSPFIFVLIMLDSNLAATDDEFPGCWAFANSADESCQGFCEQVVDESVSPPRSPYCEALWGSPEFGYGKGIIDCLYRLYGDAYGCVYDPSITTVSRFQPR